MRAKAAVMYEVNKPLVVEELEVLDPGPHEVRVRFAANGVCHSDLHVMTGDYPYPLPVVLGHEAAGVVDEVGPEAIAAIGDEVFGFAVVPDLVCYLRIDVETLVLRVIETKAMSYWESGMDLRLGNDLYDSFKKYQSLLIEEFDSTTVVPPDGRARLSTWGTIEIELE